MSVEMPTEEWKKPTADFHLDPKKMDEGADRTFERAIRETAIEGAEMTELEKAVDRMEETLQVNPGDAETMAALARVRARLDSLIQKGQN